MTTVEGEITNSTQCYELNDYAERGIKTSINPLGCIREALGQILKYCYYHENRNANRLVIIAPGPASEMQKSYLAHLRQELGIELYYQQFNVENQVLENEW